MANLHKNDVAPMTKAENTAMVEMALKVFKYTDINLCDPVQVEQRITDYFSECVRRGLRPGNMGLYSALGLSRTEAHNILVGRDRNKVTPASRNMIQKAVHSLSLYRELLGSSGKLNPATLIFWQKNYDGLKDTQTQELEILRADQAYSAGMTPDQIAERIEQDIPLEENPDSKTAEIIP